MLPTLAKKKARHPAAAKRSFLNQARVIVNPRESHSRSFDQRLRARAPFTVRNRRFVASPLVEAVTSELVSGRRASLLAGKKQGILADSELRAHQHGRILP